MEFKLYDDFMLFYYRDEFMKKLITLCILFSLLSACGSTPTLQIDFNKETNFELYNSYQFSSQVNNSLDANPIMKSRIQNAVDNALAKKGLQKNALVDMKSADLTVSVTFIQLEKESNSSFSIGLGTAMLGSNSRGGVGVSTSVPLDSGADIITKIVIDISDEKHAIWHGSDSYEGRGDFTVQETDEAVIATVSRLLANFPPQTAGSENITK